MILFCNSKVNEEVDASLNTTDTGTEDKEEQQQAEADRQRISEVEEEKLHTVRFQYGTSNILIFTPSLS
jgi:hypothetical protein